MTITQLRKAHQQQPFQPFSLFLADGRVLPVPHQEFLYIPPKNDRTVMIADNDGIVETVDLLLVVSIKPVSNGDKRRRKKS